MPTTTTSAYVDGSLTITRAPVTVTANDLRSVYGQGTTFAGDEFTSSGLQNGETIGRVTLTSAGASRTASVAGGPYAIDGKQCERRHVRCQQLQHHLCDRLRSPSTARR